MNTIFKTLSLVYIIILLLAIANKSKAQNTISNSQNNAIEIGFGFIPKHHDETFIPVIELGYSYQLSPMFNAGIVSGLHFTQNRIYSIAINGGIEIWKQLGISSGIGAALKENLLSVLLSVELDYLFDLGCICIGPYAEIAYHHKHEHLTFGLHVSVPF